MKQHPYSFYLSRAAREHRACEAVIDEEGALSYGELDGRVSALAGYLLDAGLNHGDRVAVVQKNGHRYMESVAGVARAGGVFVPMLGVLPDRDHDFIVADSGARFVIVLDPEAAGRCGRFLEKPEISSVIAVKPPAASLAEGVEDHDVAVKFARPAIREADAGDIGQILYTSGTTGRPKGVAHSPKAMDAAIRGWQGWVSMHDGDVLLGQFALSHFGGRLMDSGWAKAATMVVCAPEPTAILAAIEKRRVNIMLMVPTLMQALVDHPDVERFDLGSLRTIVYAAAPASASLVARTMKVFAGASLVTGFGQTEAYGLNTIMGGDEHRRWLDGAVHRLASIGRENGGEAEVKLVDDDGNEVTEPGGEGEICVRAEWVMDGYWKRDEETAATLRDGWLHTRDIARIDEDGYFYICDRKQDMIISGGFNVYPREVEEVLGEHDAVKECCVVGCPDDRWGEAVIAVVVLQAEPSAEGEELIAFCRERLPGFKTPKRIELRESLPRSPVGKILRREVRRPYWKEAKDSVHGAK